MDVLGGLLETLRAKCACLPDKRTGKNARYSLLDIGMAAFSVFFMQDESFLQHQLHLEEENSSSNCQTLFGMSGIPTDNHIRNMLDGALPNHFDAVFAKTLRTIDEKDALAPFRRLGGRTLIALDGTEYFNSYEIHCDNCSHRARNNGKTEYFHTFLGATLVAPGHQKVIPLPPEFIVPQDGHEKQDSETAAAKRWLHKHGSNYVRYKPVYLGDDLFAKQPMCEAIHAAGGNFIFTCKPDSHKTIYEYLKGATFFEHHEEIMKPGQGKVVHRYRWVCDIPLRSTDDSINVHWFEVEIFDADGKRTYHNSFITDIDIHKGNIVELTACGRARWKIENEKFNVLKNNGYNLEHNFGHGKKTLASMLVVFNLIAFAFHTACDLTEQAWQAAREALKTQKRFFQRLWNAALFFVFSTWDECMQAVMRSCKKRARAPAG